MSLLLALVFASEVGLGLAASADLATTEVLLRRGGYAESNPFMATNTGTRVAMKLVATAAVVGVTRELRKKGKNRAANILCWSAASLWAGAALWNLNQSRRTR